MPAAILKPALLVASLATAFAVVTQMAAAQTSGDSKSERGMPEKTGTPPAKSERALPTQSKPGGTPPAKDERAMTTQKK